MPFNKGISGNPSGKPKGTKNKVGQQLRETISNFLAENFELVIQDFKELGPKDRTRLYCDLLQYGLPKLQAVTNEIQFERLTDSQLDEIIENLKKSALGE